MLSSYYIYLENDGQTYYQQRTLLILETGACRPKPSVAPPTKSIVFL